MKRPTTALFKSTIVPVALETEQKNKTKKNKKKKQTNKQTNKQKITTTQNKTKEVQQQL